jgi:hypothetical protein
MMLRLLPPSISTLDRRFEAMIGLTTRGRSWDAGSCLGGPVSQRLSGTPTTEDIAGRRVSPRAPRGGPS